VISRGLAATLVPVALFLPTLALFLAVALPGRSPLRVVRSGFARLRRDGRARLLVGAMVAVLGVNVVLTAADPHFTEAVGREFALEIQRLEGSLVRDLQEVFHHPLLTGVLSWFYVVVYPVLVVVSLFVYHATGDEERLRAIGAAYLANYLLAQPFYFLFPVTEPAFLAGSGVRPLIDDVIPGFMDAFRLTSGIDNCFPSLHTSLALSLALVAASSRRRSWAALAGVSAGAIAFSTLYLGIHWFGDLLAGLVVGWASTRVGLALARTRAADPRKRPALAPLPLRR
jgi:membrane-associated phospholipid phosphatase